VTGDYAARTCSVFRAIHSPGGGNSADDYAVSSAAAPRAQLRPGTLVCPCGPTVGFEWLPLAKAPIIKKALITGVTDQDGIDIAEFLLDKGHEVHGIKRRASSFNT
jgi:hypothetical protein